MKKESDTSSTISSDQLLEDRVQLIYNQHRDSTKINYHGVWNNFNKFLIRLDRKPRSWEEGASLYCTHLVNQGAQSSTLKSYISAIKSKLKTDGYIWDDESMMLNALTKACKLKNDVVYDRLPIRKGLLICLLFQTQRHFTSMEVYLKLMYQSAFQNAYFGMLRVSEYAKSPHVVKARDVHIAQNTRRLKLILHSSKTHNISQHPQKIEIKGGQYDERLNRIFDPVEQTEAYSKLRNGYQSSKEQFCFPGWYTVNAH